MDNIQVLDVRVSISENGYNMLSNSGGKVAQERSNVCTAAIRTKNSTAYMAQCQINDHFVSRMNRSDAFWRSKVNEHANAQLVVGLPQ